VSSTAIQPPHLERLLRRIQGLEEPMIQVWGWPGSGRSALLAVLLQSSGESAMGLSVGDLAEEREVRKALRAAAERGARFLVASALPAARVSALARWLTPGLQIVFATDRRIATPLPSAVLAPQELLLEPAEVAALWHLATGDSLEAQGAACLRAASDGWYEPLRLALEATGGSGLAAGGAAALLAVPAVRSFLRHQVLGTLTEEERDLLLAAPLDPAGWLAGEGRRRRLVEECGLWVEGGSGEPDGPPALLAAYLVKARSKRPAAAGRPAEGSGLAPSETPETAKTGAASSPNFVLGLLGDPIVQLRDGDSRRDLPWRLRRSFQVLAFLASSPGLAAGREEVIEAVWPREGERTIDRNFHPTLSHLRRALEGDRRGGIPPPLLFRSGVYRLNPEIRWEIDLVDFKRRIEDGRAQLERGEPAAAADSWQAAWKLYRGAFLQGHYDVWVTARRELYLRLHLDLLRDLGDLHVRLERPAEALDAYRAVLVEDPLQERIHIAVMRLYGAQGRRDLVRRQYDRLCTLLLEELGVEPMEQTTREYHRLMV